ncbi:MAG: sigma-54 dependent transcriptional regulator [Bacteroidota bacterium]|jgi:DNA-binding NtrC family response regulator
MNKHETGILVVDDELIVRESLTKWFREDGFRTDAAENAAAALRKLQGSCWDIILVDIKMPGMDGIELLQRIKELKNDIIVIIITAFASVDTAVKALKQGAYDYVTKPIDPDYLDHLISKALNERSLVRENIKLKDAVSELSEKDVIIGESPEMQKVIEMVKTVAPTDTTVMIRGESGTGKELIARAIHNQSQRKYFPIVTVNCGALTETLLESELFGHEKGAFTGAQYRRKGKVELADGGTLFLDEVGNISPKTQMDLLRVLETKQFMRVGGSEIIHSDFRVICATNCDLEAAVRDGRFREDLYYRLNVFSIPLPPLRARRGDIAKLAHYFLEQYSKEMGKPRHGFTAEAMHALKAYDWPGNVRELENAIERAMVVSDGPVIDKQHLPVQTVSPATADGKRLEDVERRHIERILHETGWNISRSASILDIDRVTLYHKIEKFGLKRHQ